MTSIITIQDTHSAFGNRGKNLIPFDGEFYLIKQFYPQTIAYYGFIHGLPTDKTTRSLMRLDF